MATVNTVRVTAQRLSAQATLTTAASPSTTATLRCRAAPATSWSSFARPRAGGVRAHADPVARRRPAGRSPSPTVRPTALCATGAIDVARAGHHATALAGGGVLVTGGVNGGTDRRRRSRLYDPATASFHLTGAMIASRAVLAANRRRARRRRRARPGGAGNDKRRADRQRGRLCRRFDASGAAVGADAARRRLSRRARRDHARRWARAVAGGCSQLVSPPPPPPIVAGGCAVSGRWRRRRSIRRLTRSSPDRRWRTRFGYDGPARRRHVLLVGGRGEKAAGAVGRDRRSRRGAASTPASPAARRRAGDARARRRQLGEPTPRLVAVAVGTPALPPLRDARPGHADAARRRRGAHRRRRQQPRSRSTTGARAIDPRRQIGPSVRDHRPRASATARCCSPGVDAGGTATASALLISTAAVAVGGMPPLTLDGASDPYLPRRPDRARPAAASRRRPAAAMRRPPAGSLVAGMQVADFVRPARRARAARPAPPSSAGSPGVVRLVVVDPGARSSCGRSPRRAGQSLATPVAHWRAALSDGALPARSAASRSPGARAR
jgi:hypothetical protein